MATQVWPLPKEEPKIEPKVEERMMKDPLAEPIKESKPSRSEAAKKAWETRRANQKK